MKKTKNNNSEKSKQYRKHPIGRRLIVGVLCICLSLVSLPIDHYGYLVWAAEKQEIVMFSALPEDVREQTVQTGTELEELDLPDTLTAVCRLSEDSPSLEESPEPEGFETSGMPETTESSGEQEATGLFGEEKGMELSGEQEATGLSGEGAVPSTEGIEAENSESSDSENVPESIEENTDSTQTETVTIEGIAWTSEPEYDSETEGFYVFKPVIPESYALTADAELPEIMVSVVRDGRRDEKENPNQDKKERKLKEIKTEDSIVLLAEGEAVPLAEPGCGTISEDTVWEGNVTLADGELVVEPEATLTIKGVVTIQGNVTIRGGGKIVRGSSKAYFKAWNGVHLTVGDITVDGAEVSASHSIIEVIRSDVVLDDGCIIQNCKKISIGPSVDGSQGWGAALYLAGGNGVFNNIVLENNCAVNNSVGGGGAVWICKSELRINDGVYRNNRTIGGPYGGGCVYNLGAKLYIYGGKFIGNTATNKGGCIANMHILGTETYLYGGYFEGNTCSASGYHGSGAVYYCAGVGSSIVATNEGTILNISGDAQFAGDGVQGSGTDGVYLELSLDQEVARKIQISNTLRYPVTLYLKALEGYVIAEGTNEYMLLHERDMKKLNFVDVGSSGKTWYAVLDKEKNQVYLSENKPDYGYYVYYISNGAEGTVVDDANDGAGYQIGDPATVQSADNLKREGYYFKEWNTKADGSGERYKPGDTLEIQGDTDLYAIFAKGKILTAAFYSGNPRQKNEEFVELDISEQSGEVTAPSLADIEGWNPLGWNADPAGYKEDIIAPEEKITLTEDKEFYGVYEKDVVLFYQAENADIIPEKSVGKMYANVHDEISTTMAKITVAPAAVRYGYAFAGWNTKEDGTGEMYKEGALLETKTDMTLYAVFKRPLHAYYYSGSAGEMEDEIVEIPEDATSGTTRTPNLKELRLPENGKETGNWSPVGWDLQEDGYNGEIKAGQEVTLTDDTNYYGIYEKKVTVSYEGEGVDSSKEEKVCRANVHNTITYEKPIFILMSAPAREGYIFLGWGTEADISAQDSELLYPAGSRFLLDEDTTFYAFWKKDNGHYRVEHHMQELEGDGYVLAETETEEISAAVGTVVEAQPKEYPGFTENTEHPLRYASGKVEADGSLVLKFFYDRNVYHVDFDLNGGFGSVPESQNVRYGGLLQTVDAPGRVGYNFKGWYLDKAGSKGKQWNFAWNVEDNTEALNVTLYAKWADETAPVLGKASYEKGHKDFLHWILRKDRLKITVPITEEGSGVKQATYMLIPEQTTEGKETVGAANIYAPVYGAIGLPLGAVNSRGTVNQTKRGRAKIVTRNGETTAEFVISQDFKGTVVMTAGDWAGNVSAEKMLTSEGGGVIVEDNAPDIRFISDKKGQYDNVFEIGVEIRDDADGNVTGGIAEVSYQIDDGKKVSLPQKAFRKGIVESYWFTMKITGSGRHRLRVNAVDNAGNSSSRQMNVDIRGQNAQSIPPGPEPKTGDTSHVEVYATISMIAGFSYLLLYFRDHGMTEDKKEELVSRLVEWAKGKGGIQRMAALALIFLLLAYYHSIGKNVDDEWGEVVRSGQ